MYTYVNTSFEKTYRITSWVCVWVAASPPFSCSLQQPLGPRSIGSEPAGRLKGFRWPGLCRHIFSGVRPKLRLFTGIQVVVNNPRQMDILLMKGKYHGESQPFVHTLGMIFVTNESGDQVRPKTLALMTPASC